MSIKDLFNKNSNKILPEKSLKDIGVEIESIKYQDSLIEDKRRFIPSVDYSDLSNYVKFGSAEKYYYDCITSIYKTYPYDGSLYEKLNWRNSNSDLSNYIFDNLYPKVNGYINLGYSYGSIINTNNGYSLTSNPEYILIKGGPNTSDENNLKNKFNKSNKFDLSNNRGYNLYLNGDKGFTTEFWFKKDTILSQSQKQVLFDLWNSGTVSSTTNAPYGRFRIELSTSSLNQFIVVVRSGSAGTSQAGALIGDDLDLTGSSWNHYALSVINSGSQLKIDLYKNGELNYSVLTGSSVGEVTGAYIATIGSLVTKHQTGAVTDLGYGKLSGSIDEFRFWKARRTDKEINRNWIAAIGGGTNTDNANTNLGIYFKFNEGIYSNSAISSYDRKILDYSGRLSNGNWTGYVVGSRNTGSAFVESGFIDNETKEPILYSGHPDVVSLLEEKTNEGKEYDINNNSSLINSFPNWMLEEDSEQLKNLSQLISEYFDELYLKIKFLPEIHNAAYNNGKPINFVNKLLESHGFNTSEIFVQSDILESLAGRTEKIIFQEKLDNVKNFIYQNIYNNLVFLYRSKGTEKSIRNFLRCFGIDENIIKINIYGNNVTYTLDDRYINTVVKKKYVNFNNSSSFEATVYQSYEPSVSNSLSYIPGNALHGYNGTTLQVEVNIPFKFEENNIRYLDAPFLTSSIAGIHTANPLDPNDYTWFNNDASSLQIYLIKDNNNEKNVYFKLTSSYLGINLTSSVQLDSYDEQKWNLSVRFYHEKYPYTNQTTGSSQGNYIIEFDGYNVVSDVIINTFNLTASIGSALAEQHFSDDKRIYIGAHRQNFTGSLLERSDLRISSVRYWLSKLSDKTLQEHAKDPLNYGAENPIENILNISNLNTFIPANKTLCLHWDFENVTGSDNGSGIGPSNTLDGTFQVQNLINGTLENSGYNKIGNVIFYNFLGKGNFFPRNSIDVTSRQYVSTLKRSNPETLSESDMISILEEDDLIFSRDTQPISYFFMIEKSMYQVISDEMIKFFGSLSSLNSILGQPIDRYNFEYKKLNVLKEIFFQQVENDIDLEKYISFYRWFDQSIGDMIEQLIPFSADFTNTVKTVVESHILERNKYQNKYPTLELKKEPPIGSSKSINELKYNWRYGHAPIAPLNPEDQSNNCLWWSTRAHASGSMNPDRKIIIDQKNNSFNRKINITYDIKTSIEANNATTKRPEEVLRRKSIDYLLPIIKFSGATYINISEYQEVICKDEDE